MSKPVPRVFDPSGFSDVDATGAASTYVRYLEGADSQLRGLSRERYALLELHPGDHVLDVGCGLGHNARELAGLVGLRGRVTALDSSAALISEARNRSDQSKQTIDFVVGDAHALKFAAKSFDACWAERVLQHLADPSSAISEMARVAKPGGRIVVFEPDHETLVIDAADRATTRSVVRTLADTIRSAWIGRALFGLFQANGLRDVRVIPTPIVSHDLAETDAVLRINDTLQAAVQRGAITDEAASQWLADLTRRQEAGRFFACLLCFTTVGRKP